MLLDRARAWIGRRKSVDVTRGILPPSMEADRRRVRLIGDPTSIVRPDSVTLAAAGADPKISSSYREKMDPRVRAVLSGESEASSAIELQRRAQAHVHGERRLNIRHPGGGRGPDRKDARLARLAWIPGLRAILSGKN